MNENSIVESFSASIVNNAVDMGSELAEVGLDSILEDGTLKDIPFISTAISVYKIGTTIKESHYIKKLARFIDAFNKGIDDADMRERIKSRFLEEKKGKKELEYILLIIDRFIEEEKAVMLGKLYLSYLNRQINWEEFTLFSEMVDRFLPNDYLSLQSDYIFKTHRGVGSEPFLRLEGLGLIIEDIRKADIGTKVKGEMINLCANASDSTINELRTYRRTETGDKLVSVLGTLTHEEIN
ncbi:hypothetical protein [Ruminococcus sp.]|uniref:hypothetical protein n=1 Tax=Ruminococcus sp. TaxID=41978 RepID=UPI0025D136BA|nr:hypothetical protein [Ruminococcus sp.]MBR1432886.1 hypothetical protein [Ruminococcus sp.]